MLQGLCDLAEIQTDNHFLSWLAILHSVVTYMTREEGLAAVQTRLGHRCEETTVKYHQAPVEDRLQWLDRTG